MLVASHGDEVILEDKNKKRMSASLATTTIESTTESTSPLLLALDADDVEQLAALLASKQEKMTPSEFILDGKSLLSRAKSAAAVQILLQAGAEVDAPCDLRGRTALMCATRNVDVAVELLRGGANVNACNELHTPLSACVAASEELWYELMGDAGKYEAELSKFVAVARVLIDAGATVDTKPPRGDCALAIATSQEMVELLVAAGANVNVQNRDGTSPLANVRTLAGMRILTRAGANPNVYDWKERPLITMNSTSVEYARVLVEAGANVNAINYRGESALTNAETIELARFLIDEGHADVNLASYEGMTPLMIIQNLDICRLLIERGADVHATNVYRATAIEYANSIEKARMLIAAGARVPVHGGADHLDGWFTKGDEWTQLYIDAGVDVNSLWDGRTAIFHAAGSDNNFNSVRRLLANGACADLRQLGDDDVDTSSAYDWFEGDSGDGENDDADDNDDADKINIDDGAIAELPAKQRRLELSIDWRAPTLSKLYRHSALNVAIEGKAFRNVAIMIAYGEHWTGLTSMPSSYEAYLMRCAGFEHADNDGDVDAAACRMINRFRIELIRTRATDVCLGLASRDLPVLLSVFILHYACEPYGSCVRYGAKWALALAVKQRFTKKQ